MKTIKELADQADDYTDNEIQQPGEYHPNWHDVRDKKFAELIIDECIANLNSTGHSDAARQLDWHFSVNMAWEIL